MLGAGHRAADYHTSNREPALLTVIILARNQSMLTRACLDALACVPADLDVRLVDNASRDDTPALAREYAARFRRFTYRRSPRNLGFAVANNRAAREPSGDALLFLNNDVQVAPGALSRLLEAVVDSGGGIAGPKLLFPEATIQHAGIRQMLWGYASNLGTGAPRDEPALDRGGSIFAVTGAMLAVGRRRIPTGRRLRRALPVGLRRRGSLPEGAPGRRGRALRAGGGERPRGVGHAVRRSAGRPTSPGTTPSTGAGGTTASCRPNTPPSTGCAAPASDGSRSSALVSPRAGLHRMLLRSGIVVVGFTASTVGATTFRGLPVAPLTDLHRWRYDRLLVASQHYYAVRDRLSELDRRPSDAATGRCSRWRCRRGLVIVVERAAHGAAAPTRRCAKATAAG